MGEQNDEASGLPAGVTPDETGAGAAAASDETAELLSLIDRLGTLLERSDLAELEVVAGETGIVLRKPAAPAPSAPAAAAPAASAVTAPVSTAKMVKAPLTGIFYSAPSPASPPYITVGQRIKVGDVIGLIEAMKLFNEIKSDQAGRVVRMVAESGKLVKAKQPLIEVEP
ncbi:MAG TPA: biotin/lipoyl-containing protein [Candidatus Limnocylindrales bacterium]